MWTRKIRIIEQMRKEKKLKGIKKKEKITIIVDWIDLSNNANQ